MPNIPEATVAFLASAAIGAVWSSCSPDFGPASVVDRFAQIEPKVLFAVDGYRYGGKDFDRHETLVRLQAEMPSLERTVVLPYLDPEPDLSPLRDAMRWGELLANGEGAQLSFDRVPFDHPLWVLYSSGTTGLPKAIVQSQGGILLEHLKKLHLHVDAHPGDRLFWFTTTGWMMWNFIVSGLLTRAAIVLYDGNPGYPDMGVLWDLAERAGITMFGTSASYIAACMKAGIEPGNGRDLIYIFKKGVEISFAKKQPVHAVAGGRVVYSGVLPSYGNVAIVDHGGHYYSLCAHLGELKRKVGDVVTEGDELGWSGEVGQPLYFEIRARNVAVNPLQWLSN